MAAQIETVYLRGESGVIHQMDLPLPEAISDKVAKGYLTRVNEDGSHFDADTLSRPAVNAPKADWVGFVVRSYDIEPDKAEAMTKQDLIDMCNKLAG